jgi:hypothetical protein
MLKAEAAAHAQAAAESRQIDSRVRESISATTRRSAYDPVVAAADEYGLGGKAHTPRSLSMPINNNFGHGNGHAQNGQSGQSRNTMLLENGMVVEHVDVRKEEREERERRKREERREKEVARDRSRARKSSRGSQPAIDAASLYSANTGVGAGSMSMPQTAPDFEGGLMPSHRPSQFSLSSQNQRPVSVLSSPLSAPLERPVIPRAQSQYSLAESGYGSPRRSRFFGFGKSRDSLAMSGMSGSMVDMQ